MKTKLLILFCFLTWNSAFAQRHHIIDSLKNALHQADSDSSKYFLLNDLLREYLNYKNDSALHCSEMMITIAEKNNWKMALANVLDYKGYILMNLGRHAESFQALMEGREVAENPANEALDCYPPSDRTPYEIRIYALANIHHELGHLMGRINNSEKQKFHYRKAEELSMQIGDEEMLGYVYMNLGGLYLRAFNELDTALSMEQKALTIFSKYGGKKFMGVIYQNLGEIYERKKENKLAVENFHKSLQVNREVNNYRGVQLAYSGLANFYLDRQDRDSCLYYSKKIGEIIRLYPTGLSHNAAAQYYSSLYKCYQLNDQPDSAYKYLALAYVTQDSAHRRQVEELTRVQSLSFEDQLKAEQLEKEKAALQSRIRQYALLGGLGVVLLVAFFLYRNNRQKQKTNAQLKAQNRELAIEAALDKIRRRTLLMKDSQELHEVVGGLFQEFKSLGMFPSEARTYFSDINEEAMVVDAWMTNADGTVKSKNHQVPLDRSPSLMRLYEAWKNHELILVREYKGQNLTDYLAFVASLPHVKNDEGYQQIFRNPPPQLYMTDAPFKQGTVGIMTFEPLSEEAMDIQQRFAKVFEFTYTRFLDLKNAEAQAREAQIEAALERVRSRTMAMHKSDELLEVTSLLYNQLKLLNLPLWNCGFIRLSPDSYWGEIWTPRPDGEMLPGSFKIPMDKVPVYKKLYDAWKRNEPYHVEVLQGKEVVEHTSIIANLNVLPVTEMRQKAGLSMPAQMIFHTFNFSGGSLGIIATDKIQEPNLLERFGSTFRQTYTRFLDLQKAETQVREAQIEAALERVRSRSLAMHKTEELGEVITVVFERLKELNFPVDEGIALITFEDGSRDMTEWMHNPDFSSAMKFHLPYFDHPVLSNFWKAKTRGEDYMVKRYTVEESRSFHSHIFNHTDYKHTPDEVKAACIAAETYSTSIAIQKNTAIFINDYSGIVLSENEVDILKKFSRVFEQAYIRFLDLQIAEEQAALIKQEKERLEKTLLHLQATQSQLVQSEKLASLGELTAGIAHEIQNPLNFVNNFSELSVDLAEELKEEIDKLEIDGKDKEFIDELVGDLTSNQQKINHHGKRAASIVTGMLQHARTSTGTKEPTDLNALADEYLRLSYHGLRAKDSTFNAKMITDLDPSIGKVEVVPQDIGRVFLNIINNAFYATQQRKANDGRGYEPIVSISSGIVPPRGGQGGEKMVEFRIKDNGTGIPNDVKAKIFQPFFTTKPTGQGTGLGLSLAYDIITKGHGGNLEVETKTGEGTEFIIILPTS